MLVKLASARRPSSTSTTSRCRPGRTPPSAETTRATRRRASGTSTARLVVVERRSSPTAPGGTVVTRAPPAGSRTAWAGRGSTCVFTDAAASWTPLDERPEIRVRAACSTRRVSVRFEAHRGGRHAADSGQRGPPAPTGEARIERRGNWAGPARTKSIAPWSALGRAIAALGLPRHAAAGRARGFPPQAAKRAGSGVAPHAAKRAGSPTVVCDAAGGAKPTPGRPLAMEETYAMAERPGGLSGLVLRDSVFDSPAPQDQGEAVGAETPPIHVPAPGEGPAVIPRHVSSPEEPTARRRGRRLRARGDSGRAPDHDRRR